ncbi:MAG: hypothetical protein R2700_14985 [Solirubrobacterales bacterium]
MRLLAPITLLLALSGATLAVAAPAGGDDTGVVRVATSGSYSERIEKLPITRRAGAESRVVMSLGPEKLPRLRQGDELELTSEVQVTLNCTKRVKRCIGPPYRYDPDVRVRLLLTDAAGSKRGLQIGPTKRAECGQKQPREHHCVIVTTHAGVRIDDPGELPCPADRCFVNLVMDASSPKAGKDDVLLVGGNKPDGSIPQDRGRINAVLLHPAGGDYPKPRRTKRRELAELPLDLKRRVVYSQKLRGVERGEQLAVEAKVVTDRAHLPYSVRTSAQLVLAGSPTETQPGPFARRLGGKGEISESNGFNCTADHDTCTTRKVGVLRFSTNAREGGKPRPVYVNLVMIVGPKQLEAGPGDRYDVLRRGWLDVTRYPRPGG